MTADVIEGPTVTEPGVYEMPDETYHADPVVGGSLSFSGAKRLLAPSCPALFKHWRDHGQPPKAEFDFGHAAHKLVLGVGMEIVEVKADNWMTKAAKQAAEVAREANRVPLLTKDVKTVHAMADALRSHPVAAALFSNGKPEASLFWTDDETGVTRRGRLDWLPDASDGRLIVADYKTSVTANPEAFGKSAANYCYHMQAAWYLDAVTALGLTDAEPAFVFVVQEKTAPYLVTVCELDAAARHIGRLLNREAIDLYAQCVADDDWPTYSDGVETVSLPFWLTRQFEDF